ncbi:FKBP-type peptidyl-prolyl cis-trans isomerase [Alkalimarinus alittae]|uniref:Peptidyl-prolyl cis-trans isomerase n=1 Tax=Alkalimarinus alittae TaxID=2961619 RepID=A0ABY6N2T4_9ALTE|nr:FKBP-type peptidyl-prolyl cis-trans isomerase [Alkalimarinus alittae]UZE96425.1 FKBP-type peptidyl-prolyl cis-trans isomerase [Alkalimarinus alittae]
MKKTLMAAALLSASTLTLAADPVKPLETDEQKVSYSFGLIFGKRMTNDLPNLDLNVFIDGVKDGFSGDTAKLTDAQIEDVLKKFQDSQRKEQLQAFEQIAEKNKIKGETFLADNKNKEGVVTVASGLQYKVINAGAGAKPTADSVVKVHYSGSLIDGTVFDSSIERGEPVSFPVQGVIPGWTEALQLMSVGSKWNLYIPSDLAYGPGGNRNIGPNETLLFEVELLEIQK